MYNKFNRLDGESENQYLLRLGDIKADEGLTWEELAIILNGQCNKDYGESAWRKKYQSFKSMFDDNKEKFLEDDYIKSLNLTKKELDKSRIKLQTEKLEYNRWLREEARLELISEHVKDAIDNLEPLEAPPIMIKDMSLKPHNRAGCLLLADPHYGKELKITGLYGETLNEYSPEIFESRMWDLLSQVIDICKREKFDTLNVYDLGDSIEGLLRVSALMTLKYGVIESTVMYGRFITTWLNELTRHVKVRYQMVKDSNHCQLRMLGQPKNTFTNENVSYIITEKIMDRLENNPNFEFIQNPTGYVFDEVVGYKVLGIHGESKNLESSIKDFSKTYRTTIDFLVGGHKHHQNSTNIGIESDVITAPSIIGIDDFSMSLNKTSDAGATLFVLEYGKGKTIEYNIKL